MGSLFLFLFMLPIVLILSKIVKKIIPKSDWSCIARKSIRPWAVEQDSWNPIIQFFDSNYLCLTIMAQINLNSLRLSDEDHSVWRFNSGFALIWFSLQIIYPFGMCTLYSLKMKRSIPLPDLEKFEGKHPSVIYKKYNSDDIEWIKKHAYTKSKHQKLMSSYGYLLNDIDLRRVGKKMALLIVFVRIAQKLITALSIMVFLDYPYFTIFFFL